MRILFVNGSYFPAFLGGASTFVYWIASTLHSKKVETTVITTSTGQYNDENIRFNKIFEYEYGNVIYVKTLIHKFPLNLILRLFNLIKKNEIIHINGLFYLSSPFSVLVSILLKKKIIWSVHGELDPPALMHNRIRKKITLYIYNIFFAKRAVFHTTCNEEKQFTLNNLPRAKNVIVEPIYMNLSKKISTKKNSEIIFLGRIDKKKGIENLLYAFKSSSLLEKYKLLILGDYNSVYGQSIIDLVNDLKLNSKVIFKGHVVGSEKDKFLATSKMLFMPSHTENFGIVVIESLNQGTPVFASNTTPWKILKKYNAGYWESNSIDSIRLAMNKLNKLTEDDYNMLSKNAYNLCRKKFDIQKKWKNWIHIYNNL